MNSSVDSECFILIHNACIKTANHMNSFIENLQNRDLLNVRILHSVSFCGQLGVFMERKCRVKLINFWLEERAVGRRETIFKLSPAGQHLDLPIAT